MAYNSLSELFKGICDAIRSKTGTTDKINHQDIPDRITAIVTGSTGVDTTITSNGADASHILSGKKAWVNNTLLTGTHVCEVSEGVTDISDASNVTSSQVASGVVVYGSNGKVTGTHICEINEGGTDISDASTVSANQVANGITVYGSNGKVTGTLEKKTEHTTSFSTLSIDGDNFVVRSGNSTTKDFIADGKTKFINTCKAENLGDAEAKDVAAGKYFTSKNGVKIPGEHVCIQSTTVTQATPTIEISSDGLITASATQTAGYVEAGTKSVTKQLTTKAATTYTPSKSNQTIASGTYLTGVQTISGDGNLISDNIKKGVSIFGVSGSYEGEQSSSVAVYKWEKYTVISHGYTESVTDGQGGTYYASGLSNLSRVIYADKTFDSNTGKITLSNPLSAEKSTWATQYSNYTSYPYYYGDYLDGSTDNTVYKIKNMSEGGNSIMKNYVYSSDKYVVSADSVEQGNYIEDIYHISSSAFPTNGVQNGYWYVSQGQVTE